MSSRYEVTIEGIKERDVAEAMAKTLRDSNMPESMKVVVREISVLDGEPTDEELAKKAQ